jgi:hypothetical protein
LDYWSEVKFALIVTNPIKGDDIISTFSTVSKELDEEKLIDILRKNKLVGIFNSQLETFDVQFIDSLLRKYPKLDQCLKDFQGRYTSFLNEFLRISAILSTKNVHLLLIKSSGEFPIESSNIDCLVEPDKLIITAKILQEQGYTEQIIAREPHKYLFRKKLKPKELPLHIHTRVEWEAAEFANYKKLRNGARPFLYEESGALVPSIEDSMLITIAHYFFEDHEIKLFDLLKLWNLSKVHKLNWDYLMREAESSGWQDAFLLNIELLNKMSFLYFKQNIFHGLNNNSGPYRLSKLINSDTLGRFNIPYFVSGFYFLKKVLRNPNFSYYEKSKHLNYVLSDLIHRRAIGYIEM